MPNLKVMTKLNGLEELKVAISSAREQLKELETAVWNIDAAFCNLGLTVEQVPEDTGDSAITGGLENA